MTKLIQMDWLNLSPSDPETQIGSLEHKYAATHNPMYVWQCLYVVLSNDLLPPSWVKEYLLSSITDLFANLTNGKPPNIFARAFGIIRESGQGSCISQYVDKETELFVHMHMLALLRQGYKKTEIPQELAKVFNCSASSIKRSIESLEESLRSE